MATKGQMGSPPDWWPLVAAARYLKVPPWELHAQPVWWMHMALDAMAAENHAREMLKPT